MIKAVIGTIIVTMSGLVGASCPNLYPNAKPIRVPNTIELCNSFYVSVYNNERSAVILTSELLQKNKKVGSATRLNAFRIDDRTSPVIRPSVYVHSGYDKGHMVPSDDASDASEMRETFVMSNMTPQEPTLNQRSWKELEITVREIWKKSDSDIHVVTVAIYNNPTYLKNMVPIPSGYWKIVYAKSGNRYFFAPNTRNGKVNEYSNVDINKIIKQRW